MNFAETCNRIFGIQHNIIIGSTKSMPRWKILIRKGV